jgi:hypothetical protein
VLRLGARKKLIVKQATKTCAAAAFKGIVSRDENFLRGPKTSINDFIVKQKKS